MRLSCIAGNGAFIEGEGAEIGLWFVSQAEGNVRTRVAENLGINKGTELVAEIPALEAGRYKLEIVTQFTGGGSGLLKESRVIAAGPELTVQ